MLAVFGMMQGAKLHVKRRVHLSYIALGVVGVGSALFHATLLYSCQLLDELPMVSIIYCVWVLMIVDLWDADILVHFVGV